MQMSRIAVVAIGLLLAPLAAHAQAAASEPAGATGTIFRPIALTKESDLSFGTVVRPFAGSGVVTVDATTGDRTLSGQGGLLSPGSGGAPSRAAFSVAGEGGQTFSIDVPPTLTMTRSGGPETVVVDLTPSAVTGTLSNALGDQGGASFGVGGDIPVTSATETGVYTGLFVVTVAYN